MSEQVCPVCGSPVTVEPWWDDPEELGGACIGTVTSCTNEECDWCDYD